MAVTVAILYAAGMFLILRRSIVKLIFGLALLGHGANVLIFASSPLVKGQAPLVPAGDARLPGDPGVDYTDPLPPALILTAIVIAMAFTLYLLAGMAMQTRRGGLPELAPPPEGDGERDADEGEQHGGEIGQADQHERQRHQAREQDLGLLLADFDQRGCRAQ